MEWPFLYLWFKSLEVAYLIGIMRTFQELLGVYFPSKSLEAVLFNELHSKGCLK